MPVFAVQFTGLHQATLLYRAILRPSQHHTFPCLHHTLVSYLDTHARTHTYTHTHKRDADLFLRGWRGFLNS